MIAQAVDTPATDRTRRIRDAVSACFACRTVVHETISYCLSVGGRHAKLDHIRMMTDCVDICGATADFLSRASRFRDQLVAPCISICRECAAECDGFGDAEMSGCADACRRCAEACAELDGLRNGSDYDAAVENTFPASDPIASWKSD